jgi:hypothetical protein
MNATTETAEQIGQRIGRAMARDVIAEGMPRDWTGLDPQDADQIPAGVDHDPIEAAAKAAYLTAIGGRGDGR